MLLQCCINCVIVLCLIAIDNPKGDGDVKTDILKHVLILNSLSYFPEYHECILLVVKVEKHR